MTRRKRDKVLAPTVEQRIGTNKQRIRPLLDKCCKDLIELVFAYCIQDSELEAKCLRGGLRVPRLRLGQPDFSGSRVARSIWLSAAIHALAATASPPTPC
jgi:hypothetical protein